MKQQLAENNFIFKKKYGQNFITDKNFLASVVQCAGITNDDYVLEIGAGAGALTSALCEKAKKVISYEIDKSLEVILQENLKSYKNVKLIFNDALQTPIDEIERDFDKNYCIVANLPYYITTPLIFKFLEQSSKINSITIMVQKEVAERLVAKAGTENYGAITVAINYYGSAKIEKQVSRKMFYPVPNVDSAIVKINIEKNKFDSDKKLFFKIVKSAFAKRRKTLINNLFSDFNISKDILTNLLDELNLNVNVRGESLSIQNFVDLANAMQVLFNKI